MSEFQEVASLAQLSDPGKLPLEVGDRLVVLLRFGEQVFCLDDVCTHDGGPLSEGKLCLEKTIACPRHGAKFDAASGKALTMPATEPTLVHDVELRDGRVFVRLKD